MLNLLAEQAKAAVSLNSFLPSMFVPRPRALQGHAEFCFRETLGCEQAWDGPFNSVQRWAVTASTCMSCQTSIPEISCGRSFAWLDLTSVLPEFKGIMEKHIEATT